MVYVKLVRNLVAHGDAREGKWRGNWRMEWVASTLTPPPNVVYPALLKLMRTPRLPAVDWTDAPTDLNGLVRFWERRNLVSARVPSRSARAILHTAYCILTVDLEILLLYPRKSQSTPNSSFCALFYGFFFLNPLNAPCKFTHLNLRSLLHGFMLFRWLRSVTVIPYFWWKYHFYSCLFYWCPPSEERK